MQQHTECTSPEKTDTRIVLFVGCWIDQNAALEFKVAIRHKRHLPTACLPFIPFARLNYVTHSEKGSL